MASEKLDVTRFTSGGSNSIACKVFHTRGDDKTVPMTWTLRPIHLHNESAVHCIASDIHSLKQLTQAKEQSPSQNFPTHGPPALVPRNKDDSDMRGLIPNAGFLGKINTRFFRCEITCGLERFYVMGIVNLDAKFNNTLLVESGQMFLANSASPYKMVGKSEPSKKTHFTDTSFFMEPEAKDKVGITARADVWGLDIRMPLSMYGRTTLRDRMRAGRHMKSHLPHVPKPLQSFIKTCLKRNFKKRLSVGDVKCLEFHKDTSQEKTESCNLEPPCHPSELKDSATEKESDFCSYDTMLITAAYETHMQRINQRLRDICNADWLLDGEDYCLAMVKSNQMMQEYSLIHTTYSLFITKHMDTLKSILRNV